MMCYVQWRFMFVFAAVMAANEPSNNSRHIEIQKKNCSAFFVQIRRLLNPPVYNPPVSVTLTLRDDKSIVRVSCCDSVCPRGTENAQTLLT